MSQSQFCSGHLTPRALAPSPALTDKIQEWFYRFAASGGFPASWIGPDYSSLQSQTANQPLNIEIVSHCWKYANILSYQLSSLVLHPPKQVQICMTVFYSNEDERTKEVLEFFSKKETSNVRWNFLPLETAYLMRRAIGRNLAALNSKADWVFFTDCDVLFRENALDRLADILVQHKSLLIFPRYHKVSDLLPNDDPLFTDYSQAGMLRDIDADRFFPEERDRATGPFQIMRGDAARLGGYCKNITYYHRPVSRWRKCYDDRTIRWLLGTQGEAVEVPGFYRIRHAEKGRKGKTVGET